MSGAYDSFTVRGYLKDRLPLLAVWLPCVLLVFGAALVLGATPWGAAVLAGLVVIALAIALTWDFARKRAYYAGLHEAIEQLDHARLLSAFVAEPRFLEGRLSWEACDTLVYLAGKDLARAADAADDYERYIETWIHEIKAPIAASRLILGRLRGPEATALRQELESIERHVEQALYYARSQALSTDYSIREIALLDAAKEACKRNQNLLIAAGVTPELAIDPGLHVFTDRSWLIFMLGQLLQNAAKYGANTIRIGAREKGAGTSGAVELEVADDGEGIPEADMPKVFDRGFVGENGRAEGSATGMGLYLCARLCEEMGVSLDAYSEQRRGTRVVLGFPTNADTLNLTRP